MVSPACITERTACPSYKFRPVQKSWSFRVMPDSVGGMRTILLHGVVSASQLRLSAPRSLVGANAPPGNQDSRPGATSTPSQCVLSFCKARMSYALFAIDVVILLIVLTGAVWSHVG